MTKEAQRIAIAEACGWKDITDYGAHVYWQSPDGRQFFQGVGGVLPHYLEDLNACHEMEAHVNVPNYVYALGNIVCADVEEDAQIDTGDFFLMLNATAPQRCEAFLRATGRWIE